MKIEKQGSGEEIDQNEGSHQDALVFLFMQRLGREGARKPSETSLYQI